MYHIQLSKGALEDLRWFNKYERTLILDEIGKQLLYEPFVETRNRKMLRANRLAQWELRVDRYRIFYQENETEGNIDITAVGFKDHGVLLIRGKEVKL